MGLIKTATITVSIILCVATLSSGGWQGPAEIFNGGWGAGEVNFGIEHGDTSDRFPSLAAVLFDGRIFISDQVNEREVVYKNDGTLVKIVPWYLYQNNAKSMNPEFPSNQYRNVQGYTPEGNVWIEISHNYALKSPTGQLIKTSAERPSELGRISEQPLSGGKYKITIAYPDITFSILGGPFEKYQREAAGRLNAVSGKLAKKYSQCGKAVGTLVVPQDESTLVSPGGGGFEERRQLVAQYGEPVIAPNGDVYTWKRTPDKYSILKWTWVDDPNIPSGPDAPTSLAAVPSLNGIALSWKASPQDPGCVTTYEIYRATSAGGVGTTIGTVNAGQLKYNDTTATAGTTYYYKVRAMSGSDASPYTTEASAKR